MTAFYDLTLFCDAEDCDYEFTSGPSESPNLAKAVREAVTHGWRPYGEKFYCPHCVDNSTIAIWSPELDRRVFIAPDHQEEPGGYLRSCVELIPGNLTFYSYLTTNPS